MRKSIWKGLRGHQLAEWRHSGLKVCVTKYYGTPLTAFLEALC